MKKDNKSIKYLFEYKLFNKEVKIFFYKVIK